MAEQSDAPRRSGWREVAVVATALAAVSAFWLAKTYFGARSDIPAQELPILALIAAGVVAVQVAIVRAMPRFAAPLGALFGAINTYCLYGVLAPGLTTLPLALQAALYAGIAFLYFAVLDVALKRPRLGRVLLFAAPVVVLAFVAVSYMAGSDTPDAEPAARQSTAKPLSRPNIYFLSYDSLLPESLAKAYLGIPRPAYIDVIERHGGRLLPNTFADAVPTKFSLSSVLMLKANVDNTDNVMNGFSASPLRDTLSTWGYETHFVFELSFFGNKNGPHLDHYRVYRPYSLCSFLRGKRRFLGFFGYCKLKWLHPESDTELPAETYEDFSFSQLKAVSENPTDRPQFYMEHVLTPHHTASEYDGSPAQKTAFVARYLRDAAATAQTMDRALTQLRSADPDAVIFVYGDHGTFTSRKVDVKKDPRTVVQDTHGTVAAVFNADQCLPFIDAPGGGKFHTTASIAAGILQCLSEGHPAPRPDVDYGRIVQIPTAKRFDAYVYE